MLGVCIIALFAFVGLAVDLGILAVSRTQSQNAADVASLVGCRTLNNKDGVLYSNLPAAIVAARNEVTSNPHLSALLTNAQISKIEVGQYLYDTNTQTFQVSTWVDVTSGGAVNPPTGSWTGMRITLTIAQPTYFMRVFGVTSMPSGARATAVYRPRDIAFVLDMTGSMAYACIYNHQNKSHNPDTSVPGFGHYISTQSNLISSTNLTIGSNEAASRNNYTITTPAGPPIIRNFYFDPSNLATPTTPAFPLTTNGGNPNLLNAFHRWSPPESGGDSTNYIGVTYDFTGYDAFHVGTEATPKGPTPAPDSFKTMTDDAGVTYVGDRWRRGNGAIDKTNTSWSTSSTTTRSAYNAADLLGYSTPLTTGSWNNFRDPVWEKWGYDLDVLKYRTQRGVSGPMDPAVFKANNGNSDDNILLPTADRFVGYSMGPSYWGKTFYIWPPDPRWGNPNGGAPAGGSVNPASLHATLQAKDVNGNWICDWRRRFFLKSNSTALDPQADNNTGNGSGSGAFDEINEVLLGTGNFTLSGSPFQVNYPAILKWIKSGPQTLPPNLRAGRVLYYSSIPDDVDTSTGTTQEQLDKAFWKNYIDFVLGIGNYNSTTNLYGAADSWSVNPVGNLTGDLTQYTFTWEGTASRPYMRYTASPKRPRQHMWFGPLSMVHFMNRATTSKDNWLPGTCYEAQNWQLKAGMQSVLEDVKNNHPNDVAGVVMFAAPQHNGIRSPMSQDYKALKNCLFYPKNLLPVINTGDITTEYRPYTNTSLSGYQDVEIPNAVGSTDPNTGLAYAYNLLSPSSIPAATALGAGGGRRGAQKLVIFETDGVPNTYRTTTFNPRGYNSYYTVGNSSGNIGNGNQTTMDEAYEVIQQIVKPMATTATTGTTTGADSGYSLPNAPARVYPIGFGDLFDVDLAPNATFRDTALDFLGHCAEYGGTGPPNTDLSPNYVITGPYQQRINRLRDALERIFQSGTSVVLVE